MKACANCRRQFFGEAERCPGCAKAYSAGLADASEGVRKAAARMERFGWTMVEAGVGSLPIVVRTELNAILAMLREVMQ